MKTLKQQAMQCLMDHERAWTLLVDAQSESRDADIFRRVVDGLRRCLDTATASATSSSTGAAAAAAGEIDWPLAHAACRVCRVVGQTLQKAISFEVMQARAAARRSSLASTSSSSASTAAAGALSRGNSSSSSTRKSSKLAPAVRVNTAFFASNTQTPSPRASGGMGGEAVTPLAAVTAAVTAAAVTAPDSPFSLLDLPPTPSPRGGGMLRE
eukprot:19423-Heterococcus_DN1.PRE.2